MDQSLLFSVGGMLLVIVVVSAFVGVRGKIRDLGNVWAMLRDRFGVSDTIFEQDAFALRILGRLKTFDDEFVGDLSLSDKGILFRHPFPNRDEILLIPWHIIQDFEVSAGGTDATFAVPRTSGMPMIICIPWSGDLSNRRDAMNLEASIGQQV